jgi:hypothetical protein
MSDYDLCLTDARLLKSVPLKQAMC